MNIELLSSLNYDTETSQILSIEINENSSIGDLLNKIHEETKIHFYKELKWGDHVEKVACSYYFKSETEPVDFHIITDLKQKISDFPKNGQNKELSLFIDESVGLVN